MNYSPDEFEALHTEVEAQGGVLSPDICMPTDQTYTNPPYVKENHTEKKVTCGCGNLSIFVNSYVGENKKEGLIRACAVCDSVGAWPRFEEVVQAAGRNA